MRKTLPILFLFLAVAAAAETKKPKNIILFVGDGMGLEHIKAAGLYINGAAGTLNFESFPYKSQLATRSANNSVTDSAAGGTAMATGQKVNNGVVSKQTPGNSSDLPTVLELYKSMGKHTGLVTTADITDATPAAFGAHMPSRNSRTAIGNMYLTVSRPNVLFGAHLYFSTANATNNGYTTIMTRTNLLSLDTENVTHVSGHFRSAGLLQWETLRATYAPEQPSLVEMTQVALTILDNNPNGFFLLVENEGIDTAGHNETGASPVNRVKFLVTEMEEFSKAVQAAVDWAAGRDDTLIVVTSDHETGDLLVTATTNTPGVVPSTNSVTFRSFNHTGKDVGIFSWGVGAERTPNVRDNTDIYTLLTPPATPIPVIDPPSGSAASTLAPGSQQLQGGAKGFINAAANEIATLYYNATGPGDVVWTIFNREGSEIQTLSSHTNGLTVESMQWNLNGSNNSRVGAGIYLYRVNAPGISKTGKMIVID